MDTGYEHMTMEEFNKLPFRQRKDPLLVVRDAFRERFREPTWQEVALAVMYLKGLGGLQPPWQLKLLELEELDEKLSYTNMTDSGKFMRRIHELEDACRVLMTENIK